MDSNRYTNQEVASTFFDFRELIVSWESMEDNKHPSTCLYQDCLSRIKQFPELLESNISPEILTSDKNKMGFGLILSTILPLSVQGDQKIVAISKPFDFNPIYGTVAFFFANFRRKWTD